MQFDDVTLLLSGRSRGEEDLCLALKSKMIVLALFGVTISSERLTQSGLQIVSALSSRS